jgi:PBSX family phage terminase large subunit
MPRVEAIEYDPLPAFEGFHLSNQTEGALIGGYGSGKSVALCAEALKRALQQPGSEWLIGRQTIDSLRVTTERTFLDMLPPGFAAECRYHRGGNHVQEITLPNESIIYFRGLDDWRKLKSLNLAGFFLDEADEISPETYEGLTTRVRQASVSPSAKRAGAGRVTQHIIRVAMNPNGHDYYWDRFVKNQNPDRGLWLSTSLDNPYNPFSYIDLLLSYPDPWVRRYVFCSFEDFQGVIYPEWDWNTHVVNPYGLYDASNVFLMGMDPGTQNPTGGVWCYWDRQIGKLVGVAEYLQADTAVTPHVYAWRQIEAHGTHNLTRQPGRMRVTRRIADPATLPMRDRGSQMSLESQFSKHGFYFEKGPERIPDRLPALGQLIHANRFVVTKECELLYEQIKQDRYEDLTPDQIAKGVEAKPFKRNVDLVDAAQYVASRWSPPDPTRVVRVERPLHRIRGDRDIELLEHIRKLKDEGMDEAAAALEKELIPDDMLVDARRHIQQRVHGQHKSASTSRGLY